MKLLQRFLLICATTCLHSVVPGVVEAKKVTEEGYAVEIFECDSNLEELSTENRQVKTQGSSYRFCFRPNQKALDDDVGIERINYFNWELLHKKGTAEQRAVIDGVGDNILSILTCNDDKKLCFLDSMLKAEFYVDSGSVLGYGLVTLSGEKGIVEIDRYLFPHNFKFTMVNADGTKMSDEELADFNERLAAQEAAAIGDITDDIEEDGASAEEL